MRLVTEEELQLTSAAREWRSFIEQLKEVLHLQGEEAEQILEEAVFRHHDLAVQIAEEDPKRLVYVLTMMYVPYYEIYLRGKINNTLSIALDEQEVKEMLKPLLLQIRAFIESTLKPFQHLPDAVEEFRQREKQRFLQLHNELKEIIRQGGRAEHYPAEVENTSSLEEAQQKVEVLAEELEQVQKEKSAVEAISFPDDAKPCIIKALLPHVEPESKEHLATLINEGLCKIPVHFMSNLRRLSTFFKVIHDVELAHTPEKSIFCKWVVRHFYIKGVDKVYAPINYSRTYKCMSEKDRQAAKPIPYVK